MRAYTVQELDALRELVKMKYLFGTYRSPSHGGMSRTYHASEMIQAVEEQVRTHMLAGHVAADLLASEGVV